MLHALAVGVGGFLGAIARWGLSTSLERRLEGAMPAHTLIVNVIGCLLIGALMAWFDKREAIPETTRLLLITGFLGSFTTYSTFGHESFALLREGAVGAATMHMAAHLVIGLAAVATGWGVVRVAG